MRITKRSPIDRWSNNCWFKTEIRSIGTAKESWQNSIHIVQQVKISSEAEKNKKLEKNSTEENVQKTKTWIDPIVIKRKISNTHDSLCDRNRNVALRQWNQQKQQKQQQQQ